MGLFGLIFQIKKKMIRFYCDFFAKRVELSVADIFLPGEGMNQNQFLSTSRYLDVASYFNEGKKDVDRSRKLLLRPHEL